MPVLNFALLQDLYPEHSAAALNNLTLSTPLLGVYWNVRISKGPLPEFSPQPIREVIAPEDAAGGTSVFFSDLPAHRVEAALSIAEMQCDGMMWDDIARAVQQTYQCDFPIEARLWCFRDMIILTGEIRPEKPKSRSFSSDGGFSAAIAMVAQQKLQPLILLQGPLRSNHQVMQTLERLENARAWIWPQAGFVPDLPSADDLRNADPMNL